MSQKWYAPYRLTGVGHTGICGMGHTVLEVNSEGLKCFANKGRGGYWFVGDIDAIYLLLWLIVCIELALGYVGE